MLRRVRWGPVAGQEDGEYHRGGKCVPQIEAVPDPERSNGANGGNHKLNFAGGGGGAAEKKEVQSYAQKSNRTDGECFLDPVAIQTGLGYGDLGGRVGDSSEDQ